MDSIKSPASFEEWKRYIFNRPISEPRWYMSAAAIWEAPPLLAVGYLATLFENAEKNLAPFTDAQVNYGLTYLVHEMGTGYMDVVVRDWEQTDTGITWPQRRRAIGSINVLFSECFAKRCTPHLSVLDEPGRSPLNEICYMWWDIFPCTGQPKKPEYQDRDAELLSVMEKTLLLPHIACQEGALHGLGHWRRAYPERVEKTIDAFLARKKNIRPELKDYALRARIGMVQ